MLRRCLEKDPSKRIRDIGDVSLAMEGAFEATDSAPSELTAAPRLRLWQQPVPALVIALLVAVIAGLAVWNLTGPTPSVQRVERFAIPPPAPFAPSRSSTLAISSDGTKVVYIARGGNSLQLYVRAVGDLTTTPLQGLDGEVFGPFFSPDGAWVGFDDESDNTLKRVSILGGPAVTICATGANVVLGASWGEDNTIIFGNDNPSGLGECRTVEVNPKRSPLSTRNKN